MFFLSKCGEKSKLPKNVVFTYGCSGSLNLFSLRMWKDVPNAKQWVIFISGSGGSNKRLFSECAGEVQKCIKKFGVTATGRGPK